MSKYAAFGTTLYKGTSGAGTAIAQIKTISGPELSLDTVDVTSHDSTDGWEEVVGTILRSGEVTFEIEYDPAGATHKYAAGGLLYDYVQKTANTYTLVFPDAGSTEWSFSALITGFNPGMPVDGDLTASVKMKVTGVVTLE